MSSTILYEPTEWKTVCDRGIINYGNLFPIQKAMRKAMEGKTIRIGFIGGSITAGSLSGTPYTCYAYLVYNWWREKFPMSQVDYINAGIGATTSRFGVARVSEDLLCYNPDVVFVEFSVNDSNEEKYMETYEGLIRRILSDACGPSVILINNVDYNSGINAQEIHNRVGIYYNLPIISIKDSIYAEIQAGRIAAKEITPDGLHPNDKGHGLVSQVIINLMEAVYDRIVNNLDADKDYLFPERPITRNRYRDSVLWNNRNMDSVLHGFKKDKAMKKGWGDVFKNGWYASTKGSKISFYAEYSTLAVLYRKYAKGKSPKAKLVLDKKEEEAIILDSEFDEDWGDCLYLHEIIYDRGFDMHLVEITIIKEAGNREFYLASIITA